MATALENLETRRDAICAELAAIDANAAGGKPNNSKTGTDHVGYKDGLLRELESIVAAIDLISAQSTSGTFEVSSGVDT